MLWSDRGPQHDAPLDESRQDERRGTLPPPEWTSPRPGWSRPPTTAAEPLPRRTGGRADEAWLRARVEEARAASSEDALREACSSLARWLASRERDLDEAVELGTTALSLGDDTELRREVSAWLESLGEAPRAAAVLKTLATMDDVESSEAAYVLVRTGVLKARAGTAAAAAAAFEAAISIDEDDPLPAELLGALSAWQPAAVPPATGAEAYVTGARRRGAQFQRDAEEEDLWRAAATDPCSALATEGIAAFLEASGRVAAADEAWRAHSIAVRAIDLAQGVELNARRRSAARLAGDSLGAFAAGLDQRLDEAIDGVEAEEFDALLLEVGMLDAIAARLELRAERSPFASERAAHLVELGKLTAGPLGTPQRALSAYAKALAADPSSEMAVLGLRSILQEPPRIDGPFDTGRGDSLNALAAAAQALPSEAERLAFLTDRLNRAPLRAPLRPSQDGSDDALSPTHPWIGALAGNDAGARLDGIERVAELSSPALRAVLFAVSAERRLGMGDTSGARRCAERAVAADPTSIRSIATFADAVTRETDRAAAAALERAIAVVGPRHSWCVGLADALDALGDRDRAVAWTQRCVALRPGDIGAAEKLFERLRQAGDTSRLAEALAWLLSQPQPLSEIAASFGMALRELARTDSDRAVVVARRALDVFGPKSAPVRDALLDAAACAGDDSFVVAIFERWLSCGAEGADRRQLFTRLADLYESLGDAEGQARVVARSVREGLGSGSIDAHLERLVTQPATPDAQIWQLAARASLLAAQDDREASAWAWRTFGGALWDLADDRVGAIAAWQRGARTSGAGGYATFALDLVAFATRAFAFDYLGRLIDSEPDDCSAAAIAADVARAAASLGEAHVGFDLAARGVARCPSWSDALEVAELCARMAGVPARLSALYEFVAGRALGRYGRRAAHYHAARFFERRGEDTLSLKHAAQAFASLPSNGSSFQMLSRAAARSSDRTEAVGVVELAAEASDHPDVRAGWFSRAAVLAGEGGGAHASKQQVDLLLRAAIASPSVAAIASLRVAAQKLLSIDPHERDALEMRVGRAVRAVIERVSGPEGARVAIACATIAIDLFKDADGALTSIERAFACDGGIDDFATLGPFTAALAGAPAVRDRLSAMLATAQSQKTNVSVAVLRLLRDVASSSGDGALAGRAVVLAASRAPDDVALVVEADGAVHSWPDLEALFAGGVSPARRVQALVTGARALAASGENRAAERLLRRALECADPEEQPELQSELRAMFPGGRKGEASDAPEPVNDSRRAETPERWTEIARQRETRSQAAGAVQAMLKACRLGPDSLEHWSALERLAHVAGDHEVRVAALEQIWARVGVDGRVAVCKRLALANEGRGAMDAAERAWRQLLVLDPHNEEADQRIEAIVVGEGRFADLAEHLARRAQRLSTDPARFEMLRAVRLRRAAILEQRLGRLDAACEELGTLLTESPEHAGALRYLADLLDRRGQHGNAAAVWARAALAEVDPVERDEIHLRAARSSSAAGDVKSALTYAALVLARHPLDRVALELRRDAARALGADDELGEALEQLALAEADPPSRSDLLVESSLAAARTGDIVRALDRARLAAETAPGRATTQLLARGLEYRLRGPGGFEEAQRTIDDLAGIEGPVGADDVALRAFLLAEAFDVLQGGDAGLRELEAARKAAGDHPLIALGIAERLVAAGRSQESVAEFRRALGGALLGLRSPGPVALAAADSALSAGMTRDASDFLDVAERYDDVRGAALSRRRVLNDSLSTTVVNRTSPGKPRRIEDFEAAVRDASGPEERAAARLALGRARLGAGNPADASVAQGVERLFRDALADGLTAAGDDLASLIAGAADRTRDIVSVRRQQVALEPCSLDRLDALRKAASADGDSVYAVAVEHVLRCFDPAAAHLAPPPLSAQPEQPGVFALLTRTSSDAAGEALGLLWDGASQLFARDPASYAISGVERVVPGATSPVARVYDLAIRALDAPLIPLFVARFGFPPAGALSSHVALLQPPSVILSGDVRGETAELWFELGRGMSAALPQNVLRLGLVPADGRAVLEALRAAFGSLEGGRRVDARAAQWAESFWHLVPARTQRRLQQLLSGASLPDYEELVARAQQSGRRVGMFLSGDFAYAARVLLAESGERTDLLAAGSLRALCERLPMLVDLLHLAVSPEYASARWHGTVPGSTRGFASGRFRLL